MGGSAASAKAVEDQNAATPAQPDGPKTETPAQPNGPTAETPAQPNGLKPEPPAQVDGAKTEKTEKTATASAPSTDQAADQTTDQASAKTKVEDKSGAEGKKGDEKAGDESKTGDKAEDKDKDKGDGKAVGTAAPSAAAVAAASQGRATRVLRRANPVRVAKSTARTTSAWAKRPSGRLILPAVIAALLLGAAGTAGAYLVPQALRSVPSPSATPGFGGDAGQSAGSLPPAGPALPPSVGGLPGVPSAPVGGVQPPVGGARPADVLTSWAQQTGTKAGIPVVAVQAYGYAELVLGRTTPSCHLSWTTIAALAKVESSHGSANGAVLNVDGSVAPPIFGLPLDGKGGRPEIRDTDQGALDGDPQFDRAVGPLQFIPQTWAKVSVGNGVDADNNGVSDPNDIDDASLAAAKYLCEGGRDLARPDAWWDAVLSYNAVRPYAQKVFEAANDYGQRSRV